MKSAHTSQSQEVSHCVILVCVLGGVLGQFSIALECFIADKPALDDSLRDGEVVLKLFCDWLRSEQRVKVEIQKSAADIS